MEQDFNYAQRVIAKKQQQPFINQTTLVYELLRDDVIFGYRKLGSKINQDQLAKVLNVSRSPIREAINRLIKESILIKRGDRSYYVYIPTIKDITYASEFRTALEVSAMQLAMKRVSSQDINCLRRNINEQEKCKPQDKNRIITLDLEFHDCLVACSKSKYIVQSYRRYATHFRHLRYRISSLHLQETILSQHKDILLALEEKDIVRLEKLLIMHLNTAEDFMQAPEYHYE